MATLFPPRRALGNRSLQNPSNLTPSKQTRTVSGSKRARSPDHGDTQVSPTLKRVRATAPPISRELQKDKERKQAEREQKEAEFRRKYTNAFPGWIFYLDSETLDHGAEQTFKSALLHLGGTVEVFFSSSVTHLITNRPVPSASNPEKENKENTKVAANKSSQTLRSPIKLIGRGAEDPACNVVNKAVEYGMKIWSAAKLESVLSRCLDDPSTKSASGSRFPGTPSAPRRALAHLLETEKIHGTTERDPTQKRHDYHYFTRGSCFVLLEDLNQELATLASHEYPICKDKDKSSKKPWPVLHCHPLSRNPFIPFDDKEKKRYERQQEAEQHEEAERSRRKKEKTLLETFKRKAETTQSLKAANKSNTGGTGLRKSLSVTSLRRRLSHPVTGQHHGLCIDLDADGDGDDMDSAKASGYNASGAGMGYIAASGNSVGITSTTGTTSTSGRLQRNPIAPPLADRFGRHVVTSLRFSAKETAESVKTTSKMGPPSKVPTKSQLPLRKSKSTNTLKLPKREEGVKPGYCESCREKFSDFTTHIVSNKHRKFASNSANFAALDVVLDRLQRRTREEVNELEAERVQQLRFRCKRNPHMRLAKAQQLSSP
ncbi:Dfp1/Him1, central region-domain-containing protein [Flammula alnicola]|nr:Dfp1/Him1, central region-domain-containing protein [Flammula alnicola]